MLEVVFNESAKGSMKVAKKQKGKDKLGGSSKDVVCIGLNLDIKEKMPCI